VDLHRRRGSGGQVAAGFLPLAFQPIYLLQSLERFALWICAPYIDVPGNNEPRIDIRLAVTIFSLLNYDFLTIRANLLPE
jgi:hypothetical protein